MITKKLAVPLINEKILSQAVHCYIATASISDAGFDMIRTRISPTCKMDIVTSFDGLTSPNVLKQINNHYQGRITLNIFTRNVLHANVFVFDLPYRKAVAFVGSGNFSMEGLKDHEELFWKVTDAKEIESVMSWFTSYFEFGTPLTESLIEAYEQIYPAMKKRSVVTMREKQQLLAANILNWDGIKFKNQFFKKEDFLVFSLVNAYGDNAALRLARMEVESKLIKLNDLLHAQMHSHKINLETIGQSFVDGVEPKDYPDHVIDSMGISFGKSESMSDFMTIEAGISNTHFATRLVLLGSRSKRQERENFRSHWQLQEYRTSFFGWLSQLGGYALEIGGIKKPVESFTNEQTLVEFFKSDYGMHFNITLEKRFSPGDVSISNDSIVATILNEFSKLMQFRANAQAHGSSR